MMKILLEPPSPLPATGGLDPPGLQIIVDKALAKKKDERYQSCGDFVESLTRLRREFELPLQVAAVDQEKIEASSGRVQREANLSTALIPPTEPTVRQRFGPGITAPPKLATPAQRQPTFSVRLMSRASFVAGAIILMLVVAGLWLYTYVAKQESARNRADAPTNTAVTPKSGSSNPPAASTDAKQHSGEDTKKKAQPSVLNVSPNAVDHSEHKSKAEVADAKTRDAIRAAITEGAWHIDRGEYQQAIQIYQEALKIDPANSELKQKIRAAQSAQEAEQKILKK
jgi:tetratricopeptide (TPR) repeat protein